MVINLIAILIDQPHINPLRNFIAKLISGFLINKLLIQLGKTSSNRLLYKTLNLELRRETYDYEALKKKHSQKRSISKGAPKLCVR